MHILGAVWLGIAACLLAAYFVAGQRETLFLWLALSLACEGSAQLASTHALPLRAASLTFGFGFMYAYVRHVKRRMRTLQTERKAREAALSKEVKRVRKNPTTLGVPPDSRRNHPRPGRRTSSGRRRSHR